MNIHKEVHLVRRNVLVNLFIVDNDVHQVYQNVHIVDHMNIYINVHMVKNDEDAYLPENLSLYTINCGHY